MIERQHRPIDDDAREVHGRVRRRDDDGAGRGSQVDAPMAGGVRGGRSRIRLHDTRWSHRPLPPRGVRSHRFDRAPGVGLRSWGVRIDRAPGA